MPVLVKRCCHSSSSISSGNSGSSVFPSPLYLADDHRKPSNSSGLSKYSGSACVALCVAAMIDPSGRNVPSQKRYGLCVLRTSETIKAYEVYVKGSISSPTHGLPCHSSVESPLKSYLISSSEREPPSSTSVRLSLSSPRPLIGVHPDTSSGRRSCT